ncbi:MULTISPECIES: metalloprotease TldD [Acidobacterium]|uniref:TldD protein n=1 Tax=Acidobacterium capsulatum (strain ATCC 51196 / DSM 11244 / BCRC 80197 / JCM 7670 / NBRC 15755 / NCIMB 13165 / 161) TaxID=240015 RepID=C1F2G6_ACIC5|nr:MULTISPECIES: metalloprotease TldD [Acidobacterium]ACO34446.1 tldD protein [Acidobacterium capsulatum ATCC 51196]HCT60684.1 metalloprotease TldD [Acidobacterium sp.]
MDHKQYFFEKFGITERLLERCLGEALSAGGDYADLYFESVTASSIGLDESIVKTASHGVSAGCGIRVLSGERTGYAYTDDLSADRLLRAARTAALIASGPAKQPVQGFTETRTPSLYPVPGAEADIDITAKLNLLHRADKVARGYDSRITQVRASYADELRRILIAASDGTFASDTQPLARMNVFVLAKNDERTAQGTSGGGGRVEIDYFETEKTPEHFAREAARTALLQLGAVAAPAGEMEVVLGPGWPGVLLHEAVGHGLEADFNRKKTSAFAGLIGRPVASEKVTVVDNGTLKNRRGSLNVDDEGSATQETVLIENGILKGYMSDKLSARLMKMPHTGNGRRESYQQIPMPRMTNTYMLAGEDAPEDILRSVKRGLYAVNFGGGSVDITTGKFVFSASEAYLIEDGKVTAPVRDATLIGNGPEALKYVSMVGHDLALDEGVGTCGKDGQSVPVGVGMPTVKLDRMTVGGTGR